MTKAELRTARQELCVLIPQIKHRAGELGLYKTMHALEEGVKAVGWECAELYERETREIT